MHQLIIFIISFYTIGLFAKEEVKFETRSRKTANYAILFVGKCHEVTESKTHPKTGKMISKENFFAVDYSVCQQYQKFKVKITSNSSWYNWKTNEEVVGDVDDPYFKEETITKTFRFTDTDINGENEIEGIAVFNEERALRFCTEQRAVLVERKKQDLDNDLALNCMPKID